MAQVSHTMLVLLVSHLIITSSEATRHSVHLTNFIPVVTPGTSTHLFVSWEGLAPTCYGRNIVGMHIAVKGYKLTRSYGTKSVYIDVGDPCKKYDIKLRGTFDESFEDSQYNHYNTIDPKTPETLYSGLVGTDIIDKMCFVNGTHVRIPHVPKALEKCIITKGRQLIKIIKDEEERNMIYMNIHDPESSDSIPEAQKEIEVKVIISKARTCED